MKKIFSKLGNSLFLYLFLGMIFQMIYIAIAKDRFDDREWYSLGVVFFPLYCCSFPLFLFRCRSMRKANVTPVVTQLSMLHLAECLFITFALCIIGIIPGSLIDSMLLSGSTVLEGAMASSGLVWRLVVIGIVGPVVEEYVYRKAVIDTIRGFHPFVAVFMSALMFSLSHGNLTQGFFTFLVGFFWGMIYWKTGRIRYTIMLHIILNSFTSVIMVSLSPEQTAFGICSMFLFLFLILGIGIMIFKRRTIKKIFSEMQIGTSKAVFKECLNLGMILYMIFCGCLFAMTYQ